MRNLAPNQDRPGDDGAEPLAFHPIANAFPMMDAAALQELTDDIGAHGLHEPIILYQGQVLDGRNRYLAAQAASVEPTFVDFDGDDAQAIAFVISRNLRRRHLDASQRAMVATKLANMRQGERTDLEPSAPVQKVARKAAAAALNVSERSVASAAVVRAHGTPELIAAVEAGDIPVSTAADLAREPVEQQRQIIDSLRDDDGKVMPKARGRRRSHHEMEAERFENAVRMVESTCENASEIDIPAITAAQAKKAAKQLVNAKTSVEKLMRRIEAAASQRVPARKVR
jgi:hypothetical protein